MPLLYSWLIRCRIRSAPVRSSCTRIPGSCTLNPAIIFSHNDSSIEVWNTTVPSFRAASRIVSGTAARAGATATAAKPARTARRDAVDDVMTFPIPACHPATGCPERSNPPPQLSTMTPAPAPSSRVLRGSSHDRATQTRNGAGRHSRHANPRTTRMLTIHPAPRHGAGQQAPR